MARRSDIKKIEKKISLFKERVKQKGIGDARYILFGSWAKGLQSENSDIDLCVISSKFKGNTFKESTMLRLLTIGVDDALEPVAMRPEDLEDKYDTLAVEVKKWGVEI